MSSYFQPGKKATYPIVLIPSTVEELRKKYLRENPFLQEKIPLRVPVKPRWINLPIIPLIAVLVGVLGVLILMRFSLSIFLKLGLIGLILLGGGNLGFFWYQTRSQGLLAWQESQEDYQRKLTQQNRRNQIRERAKQLKLKEYKTALKSQIIAEEIFNVQIRKSPLKKALMNRLREKFPSVQSGGEILDEKSYYLEIWWRDTQTGLKVNIEIDKPLETRTGQFKPCRDNPQDKASHQFLLGNNWVVIRLSEEQVALELTACVNTIISVINYCLGEERIK